MESNDSPEISDIPGLPLGVLNKETCHLPFEHNTSLVVTTKATYTFVYENNYMQASENLPEAWHHRFPLALQQRKLC